MVKRRFIAVSLFIIILLSGCGTSVETVSEPAGTPLDMAVEIINSQADIPPLESLTFDEPEFINYLTQIYGITEEGLTDGVVFYAGGMEASEIAVLAFSDETAAGTAESALLDYIESRTDSFVGYVPEQADLVENSTAALQGRYAALLICADPAAAEAAFLSCFEAGWKPETGEELPVLSQTPGTEISDDAPERLDQEIRQETAEPVDTAADQSESPSESEPDNPPKDELTAAPAAPDPAVPVSLPETEDTADALDLSGMPEGSSDDNPTVSEEQSSGLSGKDQAIYAAAEDVIAQVIADGMTPYQKELAIHDYLTAHCRYDSEANSNAPDASPDPDNDNPYGMLVNGVGICRGYSSTFQLFMDLLDIECITVSGRSGQGEHAWNMVRLDGEWYCVDVTWDDPSGGSPSHRYFNVTSQFLRETRHQWDKSNVPEATATRWAYR